MKKMLVPFFSLLALTAKAGDEKDITLSSELTAVELRGADFSIGAFRPAISASYNISPRLRGRTSFGVQFAAFSYLMAADDDISLSLKARGKGAFFASHGLTAKIYEKERLRFSLFGDFEYSLTTSAAKLEEAQIVFENASFPITKLIAERLQLGLRHERYNAGATIEARGERLKIYALFGAMLVFARIELKMDNELAALLAGRNIYLLPTYDISALKPFWALGISYSLNRRVSVSASGTILNTAPFLNFGGQAAFQFKI